MRRVRVTVSSPLIDGYWRAKRGTMVSIGDELWKIVGISRDGLRWLIESGSDHA